MTIKINATTRIKAAKGGTGTEAINLLLEAGQYDFFMQWLAGKPDPKLLKKAVEEGTLCPSTWSYSFPGKPYPGSLAEVLVASKAEESLTDITNSFYDKNRVLSPEAKKIFIDAIMANPKKALTQNMGGGDLKEAYPPNGLDKFCKADPAVVKKFFMKLSKAELKELTSPENSDYGDIWIKALKSLGIAP